MDRNGNGVVDRRQALECMVWGGTGLVWTLSGGTPAAKIIGEAQASSTGFSFVQISDSHIGFDKPANPNVLGTLEEAIAKVGALRTKPAFMIHTGDITHLSKPQQFDDAEQRIARAKLDVHYVPGEHDVIDEGAGKAYLDRYGKLSKGKGWYSFDHGGVHFVGLNNVFDLKAGGMGNLGPEQLAWLAHDLKGKSASTPIVIFAHVPLWTIAADWGWGTQDSVEALQLLARFGSVTVLNGHIHQLMQKVEGNVTFHTARSTAFPQPAPGTAPSPGPKLVPTGELHGLLGVTKVVRFRALAAAMVLAGIAAMNSAFAAGEPSIAIDDFTFAPAEVTVKAGTKVLFVNYDDIPHLVVLENGKVRSRALDTDDSFSFIFDKPVEFVYFCGLHPQMKGRILLTP